MCACVCAAHEPHKDPRAKADHGKARKKGKKERKKERKKEEGFREREREEWERGWTGEASCWSKGGRKEGRARGFAAGLHPRQMGPRVGPGSRQNPGRWACHARPSRTCIALRTGPRTLSPAGGFAKERLSVHRIHSLSAPCLYKWSVWTVWSMKAWPDWAPVVPISNMYKHILRHEYICLNLSHKRNSSRLCRRPKKMNWPRLWRQAAKSVEGPLVLVFGWCLPCQKGREDLGAIVAQVKWCLGTLPWLARGHHTLKEGLIDLLAGVSWKWLYREGSMTIKGYGELNCANCSMFVVQVEARDWSIYPCKFVNKDGISWSIAS